jgi:mono/diheme cytochrome c family protein
MGGLARVPRLSIALVVLSLMSGVAALAATERSASEEPDPGRSLFRIHCANCHGSEGRGDGVMRDMLTASPADLTTISRRNKGSFPSQWLTELIDGRRTLPAHGAREMPVLGITFQSLELDTNPSTRLSVHPELRQ